MVCLTAIFGASGFWEGVNQAPRCFHVSLCVAVELSKCPGETGLLLLLLCDVVLHCEGKGSLISAAHLCLD